MRNRPQEQGAKTRITPALSSTQGVLGAMLLAGFLTGAQPASAQESGKQLYEKACAACHSIGAGKLLGPDLAGVTDRRPEDWLIKYIKSAESLVKAGDKVAVALYEEYNKMPMPDQAMSDDEIRKVLAHIKVAGGAGAAAAPSGAAQATAPAAPPRPEDIELGRGLFDGRIRFENGGPACNACHHAADDALLGGGALASDLTQAFARSGKSGLSAILANAPFPTMQTAYEGRKLASREADAVVAFLQHVSTTRASQTSGDWGWRMFSAGIGGLIVLLVIFSVAGRRRKKESVNQAIYDRQVASQ